MSGELGDSGLSSLDLSGAASLVPSGGEPQPSAGVDFTDKYNTSLDEGRETQFQNWAKENNRLGDLKDYDMRGAWAADIGQAANGHFPDTFKKPSHPTFSSESMYHGRDGHEGGQWVGDDKVGWQFTPGKTNMEMHGLPGIQSYLQRSDPDVKLNMEGGKLDFSPVDKFIEQLRQIRNRSPEEKQKSMAGMTKAMGVFKKLSDEEEESQPKPPPQSGGFGLR